MTEVTVNSVSQLRERVANWDESIPFTREHAQQLAECHAALQTLADAITKFEGMVKDSPLGAMLGIQ